jgi:signal transduction histidine kinase
VQRNGRWAEVIVANEGPGISAQEQSRVCERFWRGGRARGRTSAGGASLRLSIVETLVRARRQSPLLWIVPLVQRTACTIRLPLDPGNGASS